MPNAAFPLKYCAEILRTALINIYFDYKEPIFPPGFWSYLDQKFSRLSEGFQVFSLHLGCYFATYPSSLSIWSKQHIVSKHFPSLH